MWWLRDDEREQDQKSGGATADRVIIPAVFVQMRVTSVVSGVAPRVVGVMRALGMLRYLVDPVIHDDVDSGSGSEVAAVMEDADHPDNGNE